MAASTLLIVPRTQLRPEPRKSMLPALLASALLATALAVLPAAPGAAQPLAAPTAAAPASDPAAPPAESVEETAAAVTGPLDERTGAPAETELGPIERTITVRSGNTFLDLLTGAGVEPAQAHAVVNALRSVFDPRQLRTGQEIALRFARGAREDEAGALVGLAFDPTIDRNIVVERNEAGSYEARADMRHFDRSLARIEGVIRGSLYEAAVAAGLSPAQILQMIRALSYDVDFQRDVQPGDRFEAMTEQFHDADGKLVRQGHVLYARLTLSGRAHELYRYAFANGEVEWFNGRGESLRKALLRTPMDGARISSRFGMRRHPIMGFSRMHRGVDFAAPRGTPIYASGDGVVAFMGWRGGYGKTVMIRHNGEYTTLYAHMNGFARIRSGQRVRQGQVIGYVGSTGMSTGPHLHYEVHRNGGAIDPTRIQLAAGRKLGGQDLAAFQASKGRLAAQFAALPVQQRVAAAQPTAESVAAAPETTPEAPAPSAAAPAPELPAAPR